MAAGGVPDKRNTHDHISVSDLPGALVVYDANGRVVVANPAASEVLGLPLDRIVGSDAASAGWTVAGRLGQLPREKLHPAVQAARSRRPQLRVLTRVDRPDRTVAWIQVDAVPDLDADGAVQRVVASLTDVTPLVEEMEFPGPAHGGRALSDMTQQIATARLGPQAILSMVTTSLSRVRPGTWVASLINKDPRTVSVVAANDSDPLLARYIEDMHASGEAAASTIATQVIETGQPVLLPGVPFEEFVGRLRMDVREYMSNNSVPRSSPVREIAALVVPMRSRGATVGTLGVFMAGDGDSISDSDVAWLQTIADRTGLAAENAQLYADAVRRLERLNALRNIGLAISGSPDLRLTLRLILDQVTSGLNVDAADVLLLDDKGESLVVSAQTGFQSTSIPEYRLPMDEHLPGRILSRPHVEIVTDSGAFSQFRRRTLFAREGFRSYCVAPLVARSRPVGVLEVFQRTALQPDDEWLGFLDALAAYAAIAIDGAVMFERLQRAAPIAGRPGGAAPHLTTLEREVMGWAVEGATNAAIAKAMHLSQSTVKFHVRQILQKVGASNRTELARMATREGWT